MSTLQEPEESPSLGYSPTDNGPAAGPLPPQQGARGAPGPSGSSGAKGEKGRSGLPGGNGIAGPAGNIFMVPVRTTIWLSLEVGSVITYIF